MKSALNNLCKSEGKDLSVIIREIFEASQKSVNVKIAAADLTFLKRAKYCLCFAKKVADTYTVVWQSYDDYLENNKFSWVPQYQVFGTNTFKVGAKVEVATDPCTIGLGEITTLTAEGVFTPAKTGGDAVSINVTDQFTRPIHMGVCQLSTGITGEIISTPIYVAPDAMLQGTAVLTPKEQVMVWFQQRIETSTMISDVSSDFCEIDLTGVNDYSVKFEDGKWSHV
jgi:hypothetical protein